jgi:hypothetical protein
VTTKGNGILSVANLKGLHIYDDHNDGIIYKGGLLKLEFFDVNGDGCLDLAVSGILIVYDEKGSKVIDEIPIVYLYLFDPNRQIYLEAYKSAPFELAEGSSSVYGAYSDRYHM